MSRVPIATGIEFFEYGISNNENTLEMKSSFPLRCNKPVEAGRLGWEKQIGNQVQEDKNRF
jgi:hypothetical protein